MREEMMSDVKVYMSELYYMCIHLENCELRKHSEMEAAGIRDTFQVDHLQENERRPAYYCQKLQQHVEIRRKYTSRDVLPFYRNRHTMADDTV